MPRIAFVSFAVPGDTPVHPQELKAKASCCRGIFASGKLNQHQGGFGAKSMSDLVAGSFVIICAVQRARVILGCFNKHVHVGKVDDAPNITKKICLT